MKQKLTSALDRTVTIQQKAQIKNAFNESLSVWDKVCQVPAAREEQGGNETETDSERLTSFSKAIFRIRYRTDITPSMQLRSDGAIYNILAVSEGPGRKQWTMLECSRND